MVPQQYCLRWKHHHSNVQNMFSQLLEKERFCDVTLYCSPNFAAQVPDKDVVEPNEIRGVSLRAHRVVLAACSELLANLLAAHESQGEPVLVIDGADPRHVQALLRYMYTGEMNVHHSQLASLLKTAEELRIKGLTDIRWNNKDEPPDCKTDSITATTAEKKTATNNNAAESKETRERTREESDTPETEPRQDKINVNGGPPPLIKLPTKEKTSPVKRDNSDSDSPSPKRQRLPSGTDNTDDEEKDQDSWRHGNLNITAERVVGWGCPDDGAAWSRDASDEEWGEAPADIASFLSTSLKVDGDVLPDEDSNEENAPSTSSSVGTSAISDIKMEFGSKNSQINKLLTVGPKSGPQDPRFTDVIKLNDYLRTGRRPQFWEEHYVKRVMEAVRMKELEMKQAAEILGVSYGTLYGRYRDVYGCINRPYRTCRDFWQAKGPSEVLEKLQRGEISIEGGALALGVSPSSLAAYLTDPVPNIEEKFEPIPIEIDPSLKMRSAGASASIVKALQKNIANKEKSKKISVSSANDEDSIPANIIQTTEAKPQAETSPTAGASTSPGKWPSIRIASIDSLRGESTSPPAAPSPSIIMKSRPDLTIIAAKKNTS